MAAPTVPPTFAIVLHELRRWSEEAGRLHEHELAECQRSWKEHSRGQEQEIERLHARITQMEKGVKAMDQLKKMEKLKADAGVARGTKRIAPTIVEPPPGSFAARGSEPRAAGTFHSPVAGVPLPPPPTRVASQASSNEEAAPWKRKPVENVSKIEAPPGSFELKIPPLRNGKDGDVHGDYSGFIKTAYGDFMQMGYGFITCDDLQQDVSVDKKDLGDFDAKKGAPVEFEAYWHKGRLHGRHLRAPSSKSAGGAQDDEVLGEYVGFVKSFNHEKGFGFISCNAVENEDYKTDVYIHIKMAGSFDMTPKTPVLFEAYWRKGRLQARHLQVPPKGSKEGEHNMVTYSEGSNEKTQEEVLGDFAGVVASFNRSKGFGFVTCKDLQNEEGRPDVYIHPASVGDFDMQSGAPVVLEAFWRKGRLQGRHLETPAPEGNLDDDVVGDYVGVVKWMNWEKGFGFITCDVLENEEGKPDVYIHKTNVGDFDLQPGAEVEFQAYWCKGRLQCRDLRIPSEHPQDGGEDEDEFLGENVGIVKAFYPQKKYGFIACDKLAHIAQSNGKRDVFLHQKFLGDFPIEVGMEVRFEAFMTKGQIQARSLENITGMGAVGSHEGASDQDDEEEEDLGDHSGVLKVVPTKVVLGLITCDALREMSSNGDGAVKVLHTEIAFPRDMAQKGLHVKFQAYLKGGRLQARDVEQFEESPAKRRKDE